MFIQSSAPQDSLILQLLPLVIRANEVLYEEFQQYCAGAVFDIQRKSDQSSVTQADFRVNEYITAELQQCFPQLPILSEEGQHDQRNTWQSFWLLDPLDGTKEFINKRPQFTINLSLVEGAETTFAILAIPAEQRIYICPKQGLPLRYDVLTKQWWVYQEYTASDMLKVGLSHSTQQKPQYQDYLDALGQLHDYRSYKAGSAYKFCMMLEDKVDLYPRFHPTSEWDTSAGQCLLERIGGGLVDLKNRPFLYNQRDTLLNSGFIAFKNEKTRILAFETLAIIQRAD